MNFLITDPAANAEAVEAIKRSVPFDKYEHKREGLTCDEALEAAVLGYRVRCEDMAAGSFVRYEFNGWRQEHKCGSSSTYTPLETHFSLKWRIVPLPSEVARDGWGKPIEQPRFGLDAWGKPIQ